MGRGVEKEVETGQDRGGRREEGREREGEGGQKEREEGRDLELLL